jgi:hypothetical protein
MHNFEDVDWEAIRVVVQVRPTARAGAGAG